MHPCHLYSTVFVPSHIETLPQATLAAGILIDEVSCSNRCTREKMLIETYASYVQRMAESGWS